MKTRQTLLLGLAGLGFVLALPAQADYREGSFMMARRDDGGGGFESRRDQRDEQRAKSSKKQPPRNATHDSEPDGYGYGYERRQQEQPPRDDGHRGRRQ